MGREELRHELLRGWSPIFCWALKPRKRAARQAGALLLLSAQSLPQLCEVFVFFIFLFFNDCLALEEAQPWVLSCGPPRCAGSVVRHTPSSLGTKGSNLQQSRLQHAQATLAGAPAAAFFVAVCTQAGEIKTRSCLSVCLQLRPGVSRAGIPSVWFPLPRESSLLSLPTLRRKGKCEPSVDQSKMLFAALSDKTRNLFLLFLARGRQEMVFSRF